ncbi:Peptidoglycan/LPS O-acetylase OafA/YrhL, contains acyltransferase and SGNH-hydrolase domains [Pseudomonas sp. ok272]|uniref:acyltransferase family protein n=1 Tax=unclassified Pseudomonas TaxID=196821 RepID=UPI0008ADE934|nr:MULTISPECIES: acyltransferase [unclassified Pseudomonas]SEM61689.1 Peptidoglycan/LPS O-acetylase OafA/YrhL, contains acyltransferase and SGNH-hydrolase domains [Pseudomonas sp. ok272]SFM48497.1 Peptidoglycan/LPS O-acetylase OafA/YrhL, contains acyltransferase and SGNH-hydrolase domains [Pseudomonas sp. ok602]
MSNKKNLEIEYLRGMAIGLTIIGHSMMLLPFYKDFFARLFNLYAMGTGVDLFFCISGFVVSKAYLDYFDKHRQQGSYGLATYTFWLRRAYRLLPTAWLWVLIPLLFSIFYNQSNAFDSWFNNLRSFTAIATFSGNLANQYGVILGPNSVYWSLALEEQFYFVFPLFLLLITAPRWRVIALLLLIAAQFGLDRNMFAPAPAAMLFSFRLDAMMWGILLCMFTRTDLYKQMEPTVLRSSPLKRLGITVFLLYMLGAVGAQMSATPIAYGLIAIVSVIFVWLASYQKGYIFSPLPLSLILEWLGSRSYALYVIHMFAFHLSTEIWSRVATEQGLTLAQGFTTELILTSAVILLVCAELNYRFIETPLRRRGADIARRKLAHLDAVPVPPPSRGTGAGILSGAEKG